MELDGKLEALGFGLEFRVSVSLLSRLHDFHSFVSLEKRFVFSHCQNEQNRYARRQFVLSPFPYAPRLQRHVKAFSFHIHISHSGS